MVILPTSKAGPGGSIGNDPLIDGKAGLSRWQNIFFCEVRDGAREVAQLVG